MRRIPEATACILVVRPPRLRPIAWFCPPFPQAAQRCALELVLSMPCDPLAFASAGVVSIHSQKRTSSNDTSPDFSPVQLNADSFPK
jgi:hypothetical protein